MSDGISIVPLTHEHLRAFFGHDEAAGLTIKGFAAIDGEAIIAVGGAYYVAGRTHAFLNLTPEARRFKKLIHKAGVEFVGMMKRDGRKYVFLHRDPNEPNADRWLRRLGFEPAPGSDMAYMWRAEGCA